VIFLFGSFPTVSETFLLREMNALARGGLAIRPAALDRGSQALVHPSAEPWLGRVVYRLPPASAAFWLSALACMVTSPVAFTAAARMALGMTRRSPGRLREALVSLLTAACLAWQLRGDGARHVHATWAGDVATVGLLLAEMQGAPFSFAAHAADIFTPAAAFLDLKAREADFAVVCSHIGYQVIRDHFPPRQRARLHLVRHGLDLAVYTPRLRPRRARACILSVGRLVPKKGFVHLLRAAALVAARERVDFELHIYGGGPQERELRQIINGLQLSDRTFLHGPAPEPKVVEAYQEADLFVLASAQTADGNNEGVPNVLVEALAMQVPVVATRTGGIPELIQDGVTGLLVEPGDHAELAAAIQRLLTDDELRASVTGAGRLRVEQEYDLAVNARELAELFRAAAG
jgi:glycosyltransferase involved in cell wall biosynthesis